MATLKVDGLVFPIEDYEPTISDLDASANRSTSGLTYRDRVAIKRQINLHYSFLKASDWSKMLKSLKKEFFPVEYYDPEENRVRKGNFYTSDRTQKAAALNPDGSVYLWRDISFTLVER